MPATASSTRKLSVVADAEERARDTHSYPVRRRVRPHAARTDRRVEPDAPVDERLPDGELELSPVERQRGAEPDQVGAYRPATRRRRPQARRRPTCREPPDSGPCRQPLSSSANCPSRKRSAPDISSSAYTPTMSA